MTGPTALKRTLLGLGTLLVLALVVAGCGGSSDSGGTKIALLLPENETPRYETNDRPDFEDAIAELCDDCDVIYSNAGGDAQKQQSQAEAALTQGAEVLVVDPMDSKSAAAIAEKAQAQNVPVLSYILLGGKCRACKRHISARYPAIELVTGLAFAFVPVMGLATGDAEERDGGLASGLMTSAQQIGGAIGIAVMITIATSATTDAAASGTPQAAALVEGFQAAFRVEAAVMLAAALLAVATLRRRG